MKPFILTLQMQSGMYSVNYFHLKHHRVSDLQYEGWEESYICLMWSNTTTKTSFHDRRKNKWYIQNGCPFFLFLSKVNLGFHWSSQTSRRAAIASTKASRDWKIQLTEDHKMYLILCEYRTKKLTKKHELLNSKWKKKRS